MWSKLAPEYQTLDLGAWAGAPFPGPRAYFKSEKVEVLAWGGSFGQASSLDQAPLAIGMLRFDPEYPQISRGHEWRSFGDACILHPSAAIMRRNGEAHLYTNGRAADDLLVDFLPPSPAPEFELIEEIPNKESWQELHADSLETLRTGLPSKLVLARKRVLRPKTPGATQDLARALFQERRHSHANAFLLDHPQGASFMSFTPERLFSLIDGKLQIDCIAGTRPRSADALEDEELARQLKEDPKELNEHRQVGEEILENLERLGLKGHWAFKENIMKLKHVQHLHSLILVDAKGLGPNLLLDVLHPTPAVGGRPKERALEWLRSAEVKHGLDRGPYAGPLGVSWNMGEGQQADFLVGIRSAVVQGGQLHVYGGAGIVEGSVALNEWTETANKMKNFPVPADVCV